MFEGTFGVTGLAIFLPKMVNRIEHICAKRVIEFMDDI
jgi:hypothetical protein